MQNNKHVLVQGATHKGTGPATVCTLATAAQAAVQPGKSVPRVAVLAYWLANQAAGQTTPLGYAKGTQAFYNYLAWYQAACGGHVLTAPKAGAGLGAYTNPSGLATSQAGNLANTAGAPHRLGQHAVWALRTTLQSYNAQQGKQQQALATGTQG